MFKNFLSLALIILGMNACAPSRAVHGNILKPDQIQQLAVGQTTKDQMATILGTPTTTAAFNDNIWYYVGMETVKQGFLDPKVADKKVYVAGFDENGILSEFNYIDNEGIQVPIVSRATPTHGTELSIMDQFVGNVGRFNQGRENR